MTSARALETSLGWTSPRPHTQPLKVHGCDLESQGVITRKSPGTALFYMPQPRELVSEDAEKPDGTSQGQGPHGETPRALFLSFSHIRLCQCSWRRRTRAPGDTRLMASQAGEQPPPLQALSSTAPQPDWLHEAWREPGWASDLQQQTEPSARAASAVPKAPSLQAKPWQGWGMELLLKWGWEVTGERLGRGPSKDGSQLLGPSALAPAARFA